MSTKYSPYLVSEHCHCIYLCHNERPCVNIELCRQCTHPHPVVYLRGVLPEDLTFDIAFMILSYLIKAQLSAELLDEVDKVLIAVAIEKCIFAV